MQGIRENFFPWVTSAKDNLFFSFFLFITPLGSVLASTQNIFGFELSFQISFVVILAGQIIGLLHHIQDEGRELH